MVGSNTSVFANDFECLLYLWVGDQNQETLVPISFFNEKLCRLSLTVSLIIEYRLRLPS